MVKRDELVVYLSDYLDVQLFDDYTTNGLQIEGKPSIHHIVSGVTASQALIQEAISLRACALLVHHGYFWKGESPTITGIKKKRIATLLSENISLLAYHLPLDCHQILGNNAMLGAMLGLKDIKAVSIRKTPNLLWHAQLPEPCSSDLLSKKIKSLLNQQPLYLPSNTRKDIETMAWCSGGAEGFIEDAHALGVDAYMTGEYSEQSMHLAKELDIHFFGCGHHATERYGVKALGEHLSEHFKIKHTFVDIPNPV